jgi:flavin reductase (DIM6/NTAB) family NADH-FMN oxidoreductase RutF
MVKVKLGSQDILFPVPAALIVTGTYENPNIMTVAWIGMMSSNPNIIGISIDKNRYSYELLNKNKQFTVNIPSSSNYIEVDYCGVKSGRGINKFQDTKFTPIKSQFIEPPIIQECPFNIECKIINEISFGRFHAFFGEVLETYIDSDKTNGINKKEIDISKVDPLIYIATIREYWKIGNKLGNSFEVGLEYIK